MSGRKRGGKQKGKRAKGSSKSIDEGTMLTCSADKGFGKDTADFDKDDDKGIVSDRIDKDKGFGGHLGRKARNPPGVYARSSAADAASPTERPRPTRKPSTFGGKGDKRGKGSGSGKSKDKKGTNPARRHRLRGLDRGWQAPPAQGGREASRRGRVYASERARGSA